MFEELFERLLKQFETKLKDVTKGNDALYLSQNIGGSMGKKTVIILICCCAFLASGCLKKETETHTAPELLANEYVLRSGQVSLCEGGAIILNGQAKYFDAKTQQLVPLCTRAECTHTYNLLSQENNCPASALGKKANMGVAAVYNGKVWLLNSNEESWEFWTADMNGENLEKKFSLSMNDKTSYSSCDITSIFCEGCFFAVEDKETLEESGDFKKKYRLIAIDLESGTLTALSDWTTGTDRMELVGIYDSFAYYRIRTGSADKVYRVSVIDQMMELVLEHHQVQVYIENEWMAYVVEDEGNYSMWLKNLNTEKVEEINREGVSPINAFLMSDGKIIWGDYDVESEKHCYYIYDLLSNTTQKTALYKSDGDTLMYIIDDVWLFQNGIVQSYRSLDEEGMLKGEKKIVLK